MMRIRRALRSFFGLSSSQANGIMVLLPLLLLVLLSEPLWRWWKVRTWTPDEADIRLLDSLAAAWKPLMAKTDSVGGGFSFRRPETAGELFAFDPNTASGEELMRLGFGERLSTRIQNYRKKGGRFRDRRELLKIYGMDTALYRHLEPHIRISATPKQELYPRAKNRDDGKLRFRAEGSSKTRTEDERPFDINLADTARLEAVRGIGQKLSRRIIKYRSTLGGFVSVGQLREVFGIDSVVLENLMKIAFVAPDFLPDRLDLNTADEKLLGSHPYLSRREARAIVAYRFQHGRFGAVSDIGRLPIISIEKLRKLEPYLMVVE